MTKQAFAAKISHALHLLRSEPDLPSQLNLTAGALVEAALSIGDQFADTDTAEAASAIAKSNPQGTSAFLTVASRLHIADSYKLAEFLFPSLVARNNIALAGLWLQGTIRGSDFDLTKFMQTLSAL